MNRTKRGIASLIIAAMIANISLPAIAEDADAAIKAAEEKVRLLKAEKARKEQDDNEQQWREENSTSRARTRRAYRRSMRVARNSASWDVGIAMVSGIVGIAGHQVLTIPTTSTT